MAGPLCVLYVSGTPSTMERVDRVPGAGESPVRTLTERTAEAGFERIEADDVDCVVSEADLPDGTGLAFLRRVRERYPTLPFLLYTAADVEPMAEGAIEANLTGYVRRDADADQTEELGRAIGDAVDRTRETPRVRETERFRTIIEQSSDVVSILDREGTYVYQSPSVESVLGYAPEQFVGESVFEFVHPEDRERVRTEFLAAVENPDRTPTIEYRFKHSDGSWRVVESRGTNMIEDPVVGGMVVNSRDVTDRRRREQRMNVLNRTLRHDLRNAMNVILGNAELLMREHGTDDRAETVRSTAASMLELSNKVREIERALDTSDSPREMVDVVSVVEEYVSAVRRSRPDVDVEVDLPESEWVLANNRIGAVIDNAIENAIDHSEDPRLRVAAEDAELAGDDAVRITVADDGPGIPEEELAVLTEGGETPLEHTSGIGLWLIQWIVAESAGEVTFEESEWGGTAVRITLQSAQVGQRIDVG
jgi:PAS domain S-box-containing protein